MYFLDSVCDNEGLLILIKYIQSFLGLLQIAIPVGLIIYGSVDLGKAVIAGDEDEIKKNQQILIKRILAAVLVFFVVTFVTLVMGLVGKEEWKICWNAAKEYKGELKN